MKIDAYSISKNGLKGYRKSTIVWGHEHKHFSAKTFPILYIRKPKWMAQESFESLLDGIVINIPKDFEFRKHEA